MESKDNKDDKYESIREKLRKLLALAERGEQGEADNARKLFDAICRKYGISPDDFKEDQKMDWYRIAVGTKEMYRDVFARCSDKLGMGNRKGYKDRGSMVVECTHLEYIELSQMWYWHKCNLNKEMKKMEDDFNTAYVYRHDLYTSKEREGKDSNPLTKEETEAIIRQLRMARNLDDEKYIPHKLIENK